MNDALSSNGKTPSSNVGHSRSNRDGAATSHTVALVRMGEDGKITYGGDKAQIRALVDNLIAAHCNGFVLNGLSIEQLARRIAERGEAVEMMQGLCETMGCTLRVDPSADDDPQFVLSRDAAPHQRHDA